MLCSCCCYPLLCCLPFFVTYLVALCALSLLPAVPSCMLLLSCCAVLCYALSLCVCVSVRPYPLLPISLTCPSLSPLLLSAVL